MLLDGLQLSAEVLLDLLNARYCGLVHYGLEAELDLSQDLVQVKLVNPVELDHLVLELLFLHRVVLTQNTESSTHQVQLLLDAFSVLFVLPEP